MRLLFCSVLLCWIILLIKSPGVCAKEAIIQIIFAAEMPNIAASEQSRYAELQHLIKNQRKQNPTTFFLFGGASIGPSVMSNLDRGSHIIDLLNSLEPDAMGVAKREFSFDVDELSLRSYEAAFPIVASNLIDKRLNTIPDGLSGSVLVTRNDVSLGFISVSDKRLLEEYLLTDMIVEDKVLKIRTLANKLRQQGADLVIAHYFDSFPEITKLLDENIIDYAYSSASRVNGTYEELIMNDKRIFVSDRPGQALLASFSGDLGFSLVALEKIDLSTIPADPAVKNQLNSYIFRLNRLLDDNIAYWDDSYSTRNDDVRSKENAFANFVADVMRNFGNADVAIINSGNFRGDAIYKKNTQITRRTLATEFPFRPKLRVIQVTGKQIIDALEVGFAGLDMRKGSFPQISGMQVVYDSSAPQGKRVLSVMIDATKLDKNKRYTLATTDYLAAGGDGYVSLSQGNEQIVSAPGRAQLISDIVIQSLRNRGKLDSKLEQRIINKARQP